MKTLFLAAGAAVALAFSQQVATQQVRDSLPIQPPPFSGVIGERVADSRPGPAFSVAAPRGAPNIFLFMSDDQGFGMSSSFGGPVPTPNMDRLAAMGQRYNRFHTTGICSPSRAALLTGRNHHNAGVGYLADYAAGFPGYGGAINASTATIAQTLKYNGYSTAMFGKHHNVPPPAVNNFGPFDHWPTGLGFDYFYGFIGGDTDQWHPSLYRGTNRVAESGPAVLLDRRMADDAINWIHGQKASAPNRPFFVYYAPGSTHTPHQAPPDYIARFKGKFSQGWDRVREETYRRQIALGIIPADTVLTPRPDSIPAWTMLNADQKAFASRAMEVAAAMLAYQDAQLGRIIDEMDRMGVLENTLIITIQGDNGASSEGGLDGTINERADLNGSEQDPAWLAANIDKLGSAANHTNYPVGWAWAMDTPLRYTKQFASMLGGIRNGMILSWKGHVARPNTICAEFRHLVDIAPTLLEAAQLPAPMSVNGIAQKPLDGQSLIPSLDSCQPQRPRTQYFELGGKIGLYHDGWFASYDNGRAPWQGDTPPAQTALSTWTLYDLSRDFSQSRDVAGENPDRMAAMIALWKEVATKNNVFPITERLSGAAVRAPPAGGRGQAPAAGGRAQAAPGAGFHLVSWGKDVSVREEQLRPLSNRSFVLTADLKLDKADSSGVIVAFGSNLAGWSLYLDRGRPVFVYARSTRPEDIATIRSAQSIRGAADLKLTFTAGGPGGGANVVISSGGKPLASGHVPHSFTLAAGVGEMLDIGRDSGLPVTHYAKPQGPIEGDVRKLSIDGL